MDTPTERLEQGRTRRQEGDQHMVTALINHLNGTSAAPLLIPPHSSPGCWLQLWRQAINRPRFITWARQRNIDLASLTLANGSLTDQTQKTWTLWDDAQGCALALPLLTIADILDPAASGLPYGPMTAGENTLQLPASQVLRFYGYPQPQTRGQRMIVIQALDQLNPFASTSPTLARDFERLNQDLLQLADSLEAAASEAGFNPQTAHRNRLTLDSGSFAANAQQAGAALLGYITRHQDFLALEPVHGLQPGHYTFDPDTRQLTGQRADGAQVALGIEWLLPLPLAGRLEQLVSVAQQLGTSVHQSGQFSVAQLLHCHDLAVPATSDTAKALSLRLRASQPLHVPPVCDFAEADIALMQQLHWQRLDHDRDHAAAALRTLLEGKAAEAVIATHLTLLQVWAGDAHLHPALAPAPRTEARSLAQHLQGQGLAVPRTAGDALGTLQILEMTLPRSTQHADYRQGLPLTPDQRETVRTRVNAWLPRTSSRLLEYLAGPLLTELSRTAIRTQADRLLKLMLRRPPARQLGRRLLEALGGYGQHPHEHTNSASLENLVLAALMIELDPLPDEQRYVVAGFNLAQSSQWGRSHAALREDLELHLIRSGVVSAEATPLAAHLLLAGAAPEFLVRELPDTLRFMTSTQWLVFSQGVAMAQRIAPGSPQQLSYNDVIALASREDTSPEQQQWREYTATQGLLDWAVAQGELTQQADGRYPIGAINAAKARLQARLEALKSAFMTFASDLPTRRSVALDDLRNVFPGHPRINTPDLRWALASRLQLNLGLASSGPPRWHNVPYLSQHSLVDLHSQGWLQPFSRHWASVHPHLDLNLMRSAFSRLGHVNTLFEAAFDAHIDRLKQAYATTLQDLLAQLPLAERARLPIGELQLLVLSKEATKAETLETREEKRARVGRFGIILRCTLPHATHDYELFPLLNRLHKRSGPALVFDLGGKPLSVTTGRPGSVQPVSVLHTGNPLAIDWQAYETGSAPRPNVFSTVVVEQLWQQGPTPAETATPRFGSAILRSITQAIVERHFFLDVEAARQQARGASAEEGFEHHHDALTQRLKILVPLWSCGQDIASGDPHRMTYGSYQCLLDLFGLLMPARAYSSAGLAVLKSTAPLPIKLLQLGKLSTNLLQTTLNPLDLTPTLARLARNGLIALGKAAWHTLREAIEQAQRWTANTPLREYVRWLSRADIGIGAVLGGSDFSRIVAIMREKQWYAFDPFSARPYGPPLPNFRLDSALSVTPVHCVNGYQARVTERLFDTPPLLIPRATATDLLVDGKVMRLEHSAPTHLDDLASPAHFRVEHHFDTRCTPTRSKRNAPPFICFTKRLSAFNHSIHQRRVQALEHIRIIPAPSQGGAKQRLVYHHTVYEVSRDEVAFELTQVPAPPLIYRRRTLGTLVDEPQFGLPDDQLDNLLGHETRVVELQGIAEGIDDTRVMRAMVFELSRPGPIPGPRWVVEADTGVFFEVIQTANPPEVVFDYLDFSQGGEAARLIHAFCDYKRDYLDIAELMPTQPLVALPTLEVLYRQLAARGFSDGTLARLRHTASTLTPLKQRELLLNASSQGQRLDVHVAAKPLQLDIWPPRPVVAGGPSAAQINEYLAQKAHASTLALVERTGVGAANLVTDAVDDLARLRIAAPVVLWQYTLVGQPDYTEIILKTGAGNCDQMAHVAHELIRTNGGVSQIWGSRPPTHAFVVVGKTPSSLVETQDFTEDDWQGLWICDPWARIACPANQYLNAFNERVRDWSGQHMSVYYKGQWERIENSSWLADWKRGLKLSWR